MSKHLKRYFAPRTWNINRKSIVFIAKPSPGTHKISLSLPLSVILRDILKYAATTREVRHILGKKGILVDNIVRLDHRFPVGLFDVLSIKELNESYRVILNKKGKITLIKIGEQESKIKPYKIVGKTKIRGKTQLNLSDGKNMLIGEDKFKVGDAFFLDIEKGQIKEVVPFDKKSLVFLTGGRHIGETGIVQNIAGSKIIYKTESGEEVETLKDYAFPIGTDKPLIKISS